MRNDTPPSSPQHQVDATATPTGNLYADATPSPGSERFETLLAHRNLVVERIISSTTLTPTAYVQAQDEWVALLHGEATLEVAGTAVPLRAGDHLFLPAGVPHSVLQVSEGALWLAVHLHPAAGSASPDG
jgi:cupin 2 domain-containing protein